MHPTHPGLPTHHHRGPRAVPPKPGGEEAGERGSKEQAEDEELEGEGGGGVGEESLFVVHHFLRSRCVFSLGLSLLLFFGGEEVRVSYHGPAVDCERSWRMVNRTGLYIISP